jgi:RNA polymerase sigma-70 factor (ECF subfamily)
MQETLQSAWDEFVDFVAPFRPELHRYCRRLTGNVWDGEDLVQDALAQVFAVLGKRHAIVTNPRGYLIRTATHLWIDRVRRRETESAILFEQARDERTMSETPSEGERGAEVRAAARELMQRLAPQERAAVLMKDVFDLSLEETASVLRTTVGAVKAALHRGRDRLKRAATAPVRPALVPPREVVDRLVAAFNARDLAAVHAIVSEDVTVELVGGAVTHGRDESQLFFYLSMHSHDATGAEGDQPRLETFVYEGEPLALGFRRQGGVEGLNEIHRVEVAGDRIVGLRCYCFCPETLAFFGSVLGCPVNQRPYRSPSLVAGR